VAQILSRVTVSYKAAVNFQIVDILSHGAARERVTDMYFENTDGSQVRRLDFEKRIRTNSIKY